MTTLLTETHIHTNIGSSCGKVSPAEIPWLYKNAGYDAIVITDHYAEETITTYPKSADAWLEGYRMARDAGKEAGIKVFLGMELRVKSLGIEDFLVYGLDEAFIKKNDKLYLLPLPDAFAFLDSCGFLVYQAHPFRDENVVQNPRFMHGIEVYNGKLRQENNNEKAESYAKKHSLMQIAGSDFHRYEDVGTGGIYIDKGIETEQEFAAYLKTHFVRLKKN